jgi:tyrosine-protein phosphatase SIW14
MAPSFKALLSIFLIVLLVGGPLGYASYRHSHVRNFRVVHEGVLYRSGQLSHAGLKEIVYDHGIQTVISLRDLSDGERSEEEYCKKRGLNHHRIPPRNWSAPDGSVPAEPGIRKFLEIMDDPANYPVLIHCFRGVHRSGAYCAVFRMEYQRWSREAAMAEMQLLGYDNLEAEWDIRTYLERYQPRPIPTRNP